MSSPQSSSPAAAPRKKRGPAFWLIVAALLAAGGLWLVNFVHRAIVFEETDDAYVAGHVHLVSARLDGSVTEVLVRENQTVKAGQILARLDPFAAQIALQKNQAALDSAKAGVLQAETAVAQARAESAQATAEAAAAAAQAQQAQARLQLADTTQGRSERLFDADTRTISKEQMDDARSADEAASAGLAAAQAQLAAAEAKARVGGAAIASAEAQTVSARARVEAAEETVRDAERDLSYTEIPAPVDGRIGNQNVEVGNRVQVGQALFALVEPDCWIIANFKETQLKRMQSGQPVEITLDAIGGHVFLGKVDSVAPAAGAVFALLPPDNATGNFTKVVQRVPVKIVFDPDSVAGYEDRLRPGISAVVSVRIK